ncbi:HNH endonuclease [Stutzerimonas frequens]|uniref:HNH endonuclease n=1 Tax=Stutzerimonas frequens TaxID=2968969 RepID=UPI00190B0410|nr:HNH endonuclease signature motif containing protein [Stutzerimonas frequens]MBK3756341.1 hypothetical protein [Stutzerimonas frequens]
MLLGGTTFSRFDGWHLRKNKSVPFSPLPKRHRSRTLAKQQGQARVGTRTVSATQHQRSPWVAENARRRAKGHCELCGEPAPFKRKDSSPYLETHHIEWLANGGADTVENTVALCPNCHRKMHVINSKSDIRLLKEKCLQACC